MGINATGGFYPIVVHYDLEESGETSLTWPLSLTTSFLPKRAFCFLSFSADTDMPFKIDDRSCDTSEFFIALNTF